MTFRGRHGRACGRVFGVVNLIFPLCWYLDSGIAPEMGLRGGMLDLGRDVEC